MKHGFETIEIAPYLRDKLSEMNIETPTNIQAEAIPEILSGKNVIGRSKTGSGKTLAYLLPLLTNVNPEQKDLQAIVLAPTQELAMQIYRVVEELIEGSGLIVDSFIGNANVKRQLEKLKKQREPKIPPQPNVVYDSYILDYFNVIPYKKWIDEGINYSTQLTFGVGIDVKSDRITFPIHNRDGKLIGIKGRYCGNNRHIEDNFKYLYLFPCNKSIEFFNYHRAISHIQDKNEVIIVEGAKTVMLLYQWGYRNCISIEGDSLSDEQIRILKELGLSMKYIFAWDKDKSTEFIKQQIKLLYGRTKYCIYDKDDLLTGKNSPTDQGKDVWETLYDRHMYRIN
ncbi:MAG: DEAD/DEAH box helicase [Bacillaceae bacterium]|nr:DEAD/DEAH box helicase [Bacillaceae bacterium]